MNEYKITYTGESEGYQLVTERTEAAAKKFFLSAHKGIKLDITSIELYRENAIATKQQERDTLAAIRKMVEELGPQSYLATAFDGCFEDAENNIENDFGDSYKRRCKSLEAKLDTARQEVEELKAHERSMKETIDRLQQENEEAEARQVTETDLVHLIRLAEEDLAAAEQRRDAAAQDIVTYADDPASDQFRQAVAAHRNASSSVEAKKERLARLNSIRNAG
ncbi:hypothetical protein [uncultured Oscillibacter sp.]|uniref:hypothetical protein n=1 Tax=uncultured Oscillibacter sp. TaxID=876091 RepID=UPI0025FBE59B|nr:hypothetical protein [uncultured Oscillibacter sp.]